MRLTATEDDIQATIIDWCRKVGGPCVHESLRHVFHIPNGGSRSKRVTREGKTFSPEGARLKRLGVLKGVPDLFWPVGLDALHGRDGQMNASLFCEKDPDGHAYEPEAEGESDDPEDWGER